jgi:RNA polymerase sigma-70 factor (ECF subfamily)
VGDLADPVYFDEAYRSLAPHARAAALQVLHDPAAADDVVQDVFVRLWRNPRVYDPRRGALKPFVAMLARFRAIDRCRSAAALDAAVTRAAAAGDGATSAPAADEVLPREQLAAVVLSRGYGLTDWEVARTTGAPLGTTKSRVRIGVSKARSNLAAAGFAG